MQQLIRVAAVALSITIAPLAQAFTINYLSENPEISSNALFRLVDAISGETGHNIPDSEKVRVWVYTQAKWYERDGKYLYFHEIVLERHVTDVRAPYAGDYWVRVYWLRAWGSSAADQQIERLHSVIRQFFITVKQHTQP